MGRVPQEALFFCLFVCVFANAAKGTWEESTKDHTEHRPGKKCNAEISGLEVENSSTPFFVYGSLHLYKVRCMKQFKGNDDVLHSSEAATNFLPSP